ncbi:inner-membrane translocator [Bacillus sp. NEB1478]|uniref:inner-membrane translocator n=1 Tax=Bacillus sp. NEB1478 TaxID=3073816 RepID=UPI0028733531|nr:inner-membrane translocator [Bacillus sp. NEB1478]WNB91758.1 inner-membrane translocator [Bacillus sp. NEB1478]
MDSIILWTYLLIILVLNYTAVKLHKSRQLRLYVSGLVILVLAPVFAFITGFLLLHYTDAGEGAGYGGFFVGFVTFVNGIVILIGSMVLSLKRRLKSGQQKEL